MAGYTRQNLHEKGNFDKGYEANWTRPPVYKIRNYNGNGIKGTFYWDELQVVSEPEAYEVDKVLKRRVDNTTGKRELLIRWKGYLAKEFDQWLPESHVVRNSSNKGQHA